MEKFWVIIPAAGYGVRLANNIPKQYIAVHERTILEHTIALFFQEWVAQIIVPVAENDNYFSSLKIASHEKVCLIKGGNTRAQSVQNAICYLKKIANRQDWILTHDAARPCLHPQDLDNLIQNLHQEKIGGILAEPVKDTMKSVTSDGVIHKTVSREDLWHALTPQMFRLQYLDEALIHCDKLGLPITDESSALEAIGFQPKIVKAQYPNPKLTFSHDLSYISSLLKQQLEVMAL